MNGDRPPLSGASTASPRTDSMEWCISVTPGDMIRAVAVTGATLAAPVLLYAFRRLMRSGSSHR
jgi:hypothetical protein